MRGAYARNWSLDDGGTEEKGRWLPISMRCWRAGPSTWSFVPAHQDTSTVATPGFMSVPRAFQQERDKNWASRRSSWKEERGRLMLRGFVVLFILLWSSFWAAESDPRFELIRRLPKLPTMAVEREGKKADAALCPLQTDDYQKFSQILIVTIEPRTCLHCALIAARGLGATRRPF